MIRFKCEHCGGLVRVGDSYAGKQGWCPSCDRAVTIPAAGQSPEPQLDDFDLPSLTESAPGDTDILPAYGFATKAKSETAKHAESQAASEPPRTSRSKTAIRKKEGTFTAVAIMLLLVAVVFLILVLRSY